MCLAIREDTGRLRAYATEHNLRQIELEEGTGSDPESLPDEEAREHWIRMEVFKHITTRLRHDPKTSTDKLASGWKGQLQGVTCITMTSPADAHMIGLMDNQSEMKELLRTTPSVALKVRDLLGVEEDEPKWYLKRLNYFFRSKGARN